jgi:hypothetical protein
VYGLLVRRDRLDGRPVLVLRRSRSRPALRRVVVWLRGCAGPEPNHHEGQPDPNSDANSDANSDSDADSYADADSDPNEHVDEHEQLKLQGNDEFFRADVEQHEQQSHGIAYLVARPGVVCCPVLRILSARLDHRTDYRRAFCGGRTGHASDGATRRCRGRTVISSSGLCGHDTWRPPWDTLVPSFLVERQLTYGVQWCRVHVASQSAFRGDALA